MMEKPDNTVFDFTQDDEKEELGGSEDEVRNGKLAVFMFGCNRKSSFPDIKFDDFCCLKMKLQ